MKAALLMRTALIALAPLLLSTSALTEGFTSGGGGNVTVSGGGTVAADGTAFVVESVPGTAASAVGTDSISIGDGAVSGDAAGDQGTVAIGAGADATGADSIAIGQFADATADGAIAIGGNSGDTNSADATGVDAIAMGRLSQSDNVASIAVSRDAVATADDAIAIGRFSDATGENCIAIGGDGTDASSADCTGTQSVALGFNSLASGVRSFAFGDGTEANDIGEFAFGSGTFAADSDAHTSLYILRNSTTSATQTELFSDASAGDISVPSDCTVVFDLMITARQTDADDVSAGYTIVGVIDNNAGTTALVGSVAAVTVGEDVAGWDVDATADDTNDSINVLVTGALGDAVQWVARAEVVETCG